MANLLADPGEILDNVLVDENGCWCWTGQKIPNGYGILPGSRFAHRVSYEIDVGPIPPDKVIDHLCRNRACVNPEHLEVVTRSVNSARGWAVRKANKVTPVVDTNEIKPNKEHK